MPINPLKVFFVKLTYLYLKQFVVLILTFAPILVTSGILTNQTTFYYCMLLPIVILLPIIPMLLAIVFAFPLNKITNFMKNRFLISVLIMAVVVGGSFYLYSNFLKFLLDLVEANVSNLTLDAISNLQIFASRIYLPVLFKNILINSNLSKSLIVVITVTLVCVFAIYGFAKKVYLKVLQNSAFDEVLLKSKKTHLKKQNVFWLLVKKEFLTVYRVSNYSFSFFTIGMVTPIIVFSFNRLLLDIGALQQNLYPAISLFIILIFMALLTSFTATTITREGVNFPLTKTIPISAKTQMWAKIVFYLLVEIPAIVLSGLLLSYSGFISYLDFGIISALATLFVYGGIANSIHLDMKQPRFNYLKNNIAIQNNPNISKSVYTGLIIAFVAGVVGIVLSFFLDSYLWYTPILGIAIIFTLLQHVKLFKNIEQKYYYIEY